MNKSLPMPEFWSHDRAMKLFQVPYQKRFQEAKDWSKQHNILPSIKDKDRICLFIIDMQNSFCSPVGELSVNGAIGDVKRTCDFIYSNLNIITDIIVTLDTHTSMQIFHQPFWIDQDGNNPELMTTISLSDIVNKKWIVNPEVAMNFNINYDNLQEYATHYVKKLHEDNKYELCIWPFHAMLSSIGNALIPSIEEACFFHSVVRNSQTNFEVKGGNPLTENYSVLRPEVLIDHNNNLIAQKNVRLIEKLLGYDMLFICGEAKSHCVAWTIEDLLDEIGRKDVKLTDNIYLLEDCTSPVVIPNIVDFTQQANNSFKKFESFGMHIVKSTEGW